MPRDIVRRLTALERAADARPCEVRAWTDAQLAAAVAAEPLTPFLACLTDAELEAVVAAAPSAPLAAVLAPRAHPSTWPEWPDWREATHDAVLSAWEPYGTP